jgi:hypothetical protein
MNSTLLRTARLTWLQDWQTAHDPQLVYTTSIFLAILAVLYLLVEYCKPGDGRPPHVSSWIPWLGSGIHLATNPDKFFDSAMYVFLLPSIMSLLMVLTVDGNMDRCFLLRWWGRR